MKVRQYLIATTSSYVSEKFVMGDYWVEVARVCLDRPG